MTGASSGIGRQCAIACSRMGADVVLFGRSEDRLKETLALMDDPERHTSVICDFQKKNNYDWLLRERVLPRGAISGVVHSAGISTTLPLRTITSEKLESFCKVNVFDPILLTKSAVKPANVAIEGASIVFLSSVMGTVGEIGKTVYSVTKGGLISAVKSLALELAPKKIRVNCISPGVVESPMSSSAIYSQNEESLDRVRSYHPLGIGTVDDVANACLFLLSDESRWITGTNLVVDGGYTSR
mgnify:CR=1 FL=1